MPLPPMATQQNTTTPPPDLMPEGAAPAVATWLDLRAQYLANVDELTVATAEATATAAAQADDAAILAGKPRSATNTTDLAKRIRILEATDRDLCARIPVAHDALLLELAQHRGEGLAMADARIGEQVALIRASVEQVRHTLEAAMTSLKLRAWWQSFDSGRANRYGTSWNGEQLGSVEVHPGNWVSYADLANRLRWLTALADELDPSNTPPTPHLTASEASL